MTEPNERRDEGAEDEAPAPPAAGGTPPAAGPPRRLRADKTTVNPWADEVPRKAGS